MFYQYSLQIWQGITEGHRILNVFMMLYHILRF